MDFLPPGTYEATLYQYAPDVATNSNHLILETRQVQSSDTLTLSLTPGGGQVTRLKKITPIH